MADAKNTVLWDMVARTAQFDRAMSKSTKQVKSTEKAMGGLKKAAGALGLAFGAQQLTQFMGDATDAASEYNESINAVEVSTGDAAAQILALGETAATAFGLSKTEVNGAAVAFANFGEKIDAADVAGTFETFLGRATDFASVMNLETNDALAKFQSGLAGEAEPLRKFGLDLSAAAVSAEAVAQGIHATGKNMSETEKVQARYSLLMAQTVKVQNDFANTSDSVANQQRIMTAELENAKIALGDELLPAQLEWVKFQRTVMIPTLKLVTQNMDRTGDGAEDLATILSNGVTAQTSWTDGLKLAGAVSADMASNIIPGLGWAFDKLAGETVDLEHALDRMNPTMGRARDVTEQYGRKAADAVGHVKDVGRATSDLEDDLADFDAGAAIQAMRDFINMRNFMGGDLGTTDQPMGVRDGDGRPVIHQGGIVPGPTGADVPIIAQAGERLTPRNQVAAGGGGGGITINVNGLVTDPQGTAEAIVEAIRLYESTNGPI